MTWNVRYFSHGLKGLRSTPGWMKRLARAICDRDDPPDIIALQEVETRSLRGGLHASPQLDRFALLLHEGFAERGHKRHYQTLYYPAHRYSLPGLPDLYTTGLATLVRDELHIEAHNAEEPHDITHVRLPAFKRWKQRRIAAHVRVGLPCAHASIDLFNTHLSLPAFFEVGPHRVPSHMGHGSNQVAEMSRLLEAIAECRGAGPAVVVGDFNSWPCSPAWTTLTEAGFVDAFADHHHHDAEILDNLGTAAFGPRKMHIDHIFSTPDLSWQNFEDHAVDRGPFAGLSDHAPKVGILHLG